MMTTKLEIIGPYTPDHEGPFCTRDGRPVRLITKIDGSEEYPVVGYIEEAAHPACWRSNGDTYHKRLRCNEDNINDLMNARDISVPREFWVVGGLMFKDEKEARRIHANCLSRSELIHVREVLEGE